MTFTRRQADAVRSLVALPTDDWQPHDWDVFESARGTLGKELESYDRAKARKDAWEAERYTQAKRDAAKRAKASRVPPAAGEALRQRSNGCCEVADPRVCGLTGPHRAQHVHHLAGRGGPNPHRLSNLLHVCLDAHEWIHAHPEASYSRGWMVKRLGVNG